MKLAFEFQVEGWKKWGATTALQHWRSRGFRAELLDGNPEIVGVRGSWWGNFFAYNMEKVRTSVHMEEVAPGRALATMHITTLGQIFTEWDRAFWQLEFLELDNLLKGGRGFGELWRRFKRADRRAAIAWTFSATLLGSRLSPRWRRELGQLLQANGQPLLLEKSR
jgi:hypothetical protein